MRMHVPPPGASSIVSVPALASTKPRAIARPSPVPPTRAPRAAEERLEDALALVERDARPVVDDRDLDLVVAVLRARSTTG